MTPSHTLRRDTNLRPTLTNLCATLTCAACAAARILPAPCLFHTTRKSIPASPTQAYPMWAQIVFVWALLCCGVSASLVSCWKFIEAAYE